MLSKSHKERISIGMKKYLENPENLEKHLNTLSKNIENRGEDWKKKTGESNKIALKKFYKNNPEAIKKVCKHLLNYSLKNRASNLKKLWKDKDYIKKLSKAHKEKWSNKDYRNKQIPKILGGLLKRPTSFEQKILDLCIEFNLPFVYKGNGTFLINFKNPDFIDEKNKIAIEVFFSYYKIRDYKSVENYKEICKKRYEPAGWRVIFIDELDLGCNNWKEVCLNKLKLCGEYEVIKQ